MKSTARVAVRDFQQWTHRLGVVAREEGVAW